MGKRTATQSRIELLDLFRFPKTQMFPKTFNVPQAIPPLSDTDAMVIVLADQLNPRTAVSYLTSWPWGGLSVPYKKGFPFVVT